jgi:aarF domain-containing kinase
MAEDSDEKVPGRLVRTLKTGFLGGAVASSYLGGKILDQFRNRTERTEAELHRHVLNAKRLVSTMRELRGPLMKVGQLLSTHAEALPGEYGEILRSLQANAPPMSYATIREVIVRDLGAPPEEIFKEFSREALAAASLGQVHRARLPDNTDVVVKVQYPGAEASVDGDMKNLKLGATVVKKLLADIVGNDRLDLTPVADEIAEHLSQETDYCREAYNAQLMAKLFEGIDWAVIPRVHPKFSGLHVVTYDYVSGEDLGTAIKNGDQERRDLIVRRLSDAFWLQLSRGGILHADPHPGNYRILSDGRLGILDFGCVKIFDEERFLKPFINMVRARMSGDETALLDAMVTLGLLHDRNDAREREDIGRIADYFSTGLSRDEVFDFNSFGYVKAARELVVYFLQTRRIPPSQRDMIFLTRVVLGYYEYFSRARTKTNFRRLVAPWVADPWTKRAIDIPAYGD